MWTRSQRERKLWIVVGVLAGAIYLSAYFVQGLLNALRAQNLLRLTIWSSFALVAFALVVWLARSGARWRVWLVMTLVGAAYVAAALPLAVIQERVHLLESGAVALLLRAALLARAEADPSFGFRSTAAASCGAFALAFLFGVGDELLQGVLPNRVGDLRDVALNGVAAVLALLSAAAVEVALDRDRASSAAPSGATVEAR